MVFLIKLMVYIVTLVVLLKRVDIKEEEHIITKQTLTLILMLLIGMKQVYIMKEPVLLQRMVVLEKMAILA